jgi:hypothetical protein
LFSLQGVSGSFNPSSPYRHASQLSTALLFAVPGAFLSGAAVASQWCIYSQIKEFGALVFAATMNVRQALRGMEAPEKAGDIERN